jgi:hypothetical protein
MTTANQRIGNLKARVMELEADNKMLRAEIEVLQRMRHEELGNLPAFCYVPKGKLPASAK